MTKKKHDGDVIHTSHESHNLPVKLKDKDRSSKAHQLADALEARESVESSRKAAMAEFKARTSGLAERISKLGQEIRSGQALEPIECELHLNYTKMSATLIRTDTGEIVDARAMTTEEKQMQMDFDGGSGDAQ